MCVLTQHCKDDKRTAFTSTHKAQIVSTTKTPPPTHKRLYYSKDELSSRVVVEFYHRRPNRERRERCEGRVVFFVAVFIARVKMCTRRFSPSSQSVWNSIFFFVRAKKKSPGRRTDATGGETSTREKRDESNASGRVATRSPTVAVVSGAFAPRFDFCLPLRVFGGVFAKR